MAKKKPPLDEEDRLLTPGELAALFRVSARREGTAGTESPMYGSC